MNNFLLQGFWGHPVNIVVYFTLLRTSSLTVCFGVHLVVYNISYLELIT